MCNAGPGPGSRDEDAGVSALQAQAGERRSTPHPPLPAQTHTPSSKPAAGGLHQPSGLERRAADGGEAAAETLMKDILWLPAGSQAQPRQRVREQGADRRRGPEPCSLRSPEQGQSGASSSLASQWEASQHLRAGRRQPLPEQPFQSKLEDGVHSRLKNIASAFSMGPEIPPLMSHFGGEGAYTLTCLIREGNSRVETAPTARLGPGLARKHGVERAGFQGYIWPLTPG